MISNAEIQALGLLISKKYNIDEIKRGKTGEPDYITKDNLRWEVKRLERNNRIYFTEKQINEFKSDDNIIVFDKEGNLIKEFKWKDRIKSGFDIIFTSTDEFVNKLNKGTVKKIGGSNYILVDKKYKQGEELYYSEELEEEEEEEPEFNAIIPAVPRKIGNSYYVKIPISMRNQNLFLITKEFYNNSLLENSDNLEELIKEYLKREKIDYEELLNRLDYLESKLIVEDTYRKEKIDLQKFYEDYLLTKNVFYKMKKELNK